MTREMKITVLNQTPSSLLLNSSHLRHGKWTDGDTPTQIINPGGTGAINSQKQTGAAYGTEGECTYVIVNSGTNPMIEITWDKPYGTGSSFVRSAMRASDTSYTAMTEVTVDTTESYAARVTVKENK